jgi:flagellar biosynthetic protein FliR
MPDSLTLSAGTLYAFLLVLSRVAGAFIFVPLPGIKGTPEPARAALALGFTLALFARWPAVNGADVTPAKLVGWVLAEASLGIALGISVAIVLESFTLAAQVLGLQAGYAYASTIDPNTEADSGVLLVFAQLMAGMLFFALGLDREVLRLFALSLEKIPTGAYVPGTLSARALIGLGSELFSVGVRMALPVVALLGMVDVALALMGRLNAQLQLLSVAFPAKMLTALVVLSWVAVLYPRILLEFSGHAWTTARQMIGAGVPPWPIVPR